MQLLESLGWLVEAFVGCFIVMAVPVLTPWGFVELIKLVQRRYGWLKRIALPEWLNWMLITLVPLVVLVAVWILVPRFLWMVHPLAPFADLETWTILIGIPSVCLAVMLLIGVFVPV